MILCVDIGNTRIKLAAVEDERVVARSALHREADGGLVGRAVSEVVAAAGEPERVAVSSVVPEATERVTAGLGVRAPVLVVSHRHAMPVGIAMPAPDRVGVDRLCAASGAVDEEHRDAIVVDVGSAITVDLVRAGEFRGGVIMPGPGMMLDAMAAATSQLPAIEAGETLFPESLATTEGAMSWGAGLACAGGILGAVRHLQGYGGADEAPVWVTGGAAPLLRTRLPRSWRSDADLAFRGLFRIALLNPPS